MTAFVILHYRAIDTTRSCVKSIRALAGDKHIVIVDNASPNGTGAVLAEEFAASPDVTVLLHGKNDGFARGNNVGTRWVYEHLDADFTVVLNNDVEIPQHDFIPQIARIYAQHPFDLLGPDIVSVFSGIHPDVITVRDEAHKNLSVDTVRQIRADAYIRPNEGARKVYIFPDCTILTEQDQNVLLKIVEEGPPYAAFLFCAENSSVNLVHRTASAGV